MMPTEILATTNWVKFLGHFHPLLVHLPIGFLVLLGLMELVAIFKKYQHIAAARGFILLILAPAAVVTATCGWLLAAGGGYNHHILFWHRWLGTTVAVLSVALLAIWLWRKNVGPAYYSVLLPALVIMAIAAHFGGSLTFGSRYLSKYAPPLLKPLLGDRQTKRSPASATGELQSPPMAAASPHAHNHTWQHPMLLPVSDTQSSFYARYVQPIFTHNCIHCHGRDKQKGHLRLDAYRWVRYGRRGRPVVIPGNPDRSLLYRLIASPRWKRHHMPPRSHYQPPAGQIALIRWWIAKGASGTATLNSMHPPKNIQNIIQHLPARDRSGPTAGDDHVHALVWRDVTH